MATGVGDIFLDLKLNKQPFEKGLNETKASASLAGRKIGLAIGGAIAGAVGAVGFSALVSSTAKLGDAIDKTSQKMGMSAQAYQEWDFIMQRCGTSMESMTMAMKTLASSAVTSKDALAELGISQEEVASLSQEQLFARTIQALQNVEDTTRRTYLAGQLLGRGATELGAVLNMSASETDALRQRVYELGGVMSQQAVTASAQYTDAMLDLKMAFRGVSDTVALTVLPIITSAINKVIIPVILRAVAVVRYFGNIFASMFGGLGKNIKTAFGAKAQKQNIGFGKSMGGISKGIGGAGKSAKKAKKAVKELNRELMGFDKINKLSKKQKADGGGGAGGAGGAGGVGDMGLEPMGLDSTNKKLGIFGKLGEKLRPIWKALGDVFKAVIRLFKAIGKALAPVGKWIWEHLIKPFGKLLGMAIVAVLEGIAGAIDLLARFIEKHPKIFTGMILGLTALVTASLMAKKVINPLRVSILNAGGAFKLLGKFISPHGLIIAGAIALALAIGYIYKNWDKIKKTKFGKALIKVGNVLKQVGKALKSYFGDRIKATVKVVKTAWGILKKVGTFLSKTFKKAIEVVSDPLTALKDAWAGIKDKTVELKGKVEEGLENLGEGIAETIEVGVSLIQNGWSSVSNWVSGFLGGAVNKAIGLAQNAWSTISGWVSGFLGGAVDKAVGLAKNAWDTVSAWVTGFIGGTVNKAIGLAKNAWSSVSAWVGGFMGDAVNKAIGLSKSFGTGVATVADWLKDKMGGAVNKAIGLSKSFGNGIADVAGWLKDKMGGAVNKLIGLEKNGWSNIAGWLGDKMGGAVSKAIGLSTDFGKKVTTVADWVKNRMGGAVDKGIGLSKDFGKGVDSVAEWVKGKIGGAVKKGIGLEKSGWGKKVSTVSDWVKKRMGKGVSVGVSLVKSGWKSLKKWLFGKKGGYITKNGVKAFAGGGLPPEGQVFVAREAGPELVGTLHGRTAVMNNDQIVASVSSGVARALSAVHFRLNSATPQVAVRSGGIGSSDDTTTARLIADNREMISLLRQLITEVKAQDTNVYLDGKAISNNTVKHINQDTRRTGKLAIIV